MDVTQQLIKLDKTLELHNEAEYSGAGNSNLFQSFNSGGVEVEVGEFLYSMVRLLKPEQVLETGCHHGISACYMAQALKNNGLGKITTTEFLSENYDISKARFEATGLSDFVDLKLIDTKELYGTNNKYQLIFLDTEPQTRFEELCNFYDNLEEGGYLFIHDLPRNLCQGNVNTDHPEIKSWPFGDVPLEMRNLIKADKLRLIHFPNPRSMTGFYKPKAEDYKA